MVSMTNAQAAAIALCPGIADGMARIANGDGNMAWLGLAQKVIFLRDAVYIGVALSIIGLIGQAMGSLYVFPVVAGIGAALTLTASVMLYQATVVIKNDWVHWCRQYGNIF